MTVSVSVWLARMSTSFSCKNNSRSLFLSLLRRRAGPNHSSCGSEQVPKRLVVASSPFSHPRYYVLCGSRCDGEVRRLIERILTAYLCVCVCVCVSICRGSSFWLLIVVNVCVCVSKRWLRICRARVSKLKELVKLFLNYRVSRYTRGVVDF